MPPVRRVALKSGAQAQDTSVATDVSVGVRREVAEDEHAAGLVLAPGDESSLPTGEDVLVPDLRPISVHEPAVRGVGLGSRRDGWGGACACDGGGRGNDGRDRRREW